LLFLVNIASNFKRLFFSCLMGFFYCIFCV